MYTKIEITAEEVSIQLAKEGWIDVGQDKRGDWGWKYWNKHTGEMLLTGDPHYLWKKNDS